MILNLASDKPFVYDWDFVFFDRKSLEKDLSAFFYKNKDKLSTLKVITWPGYFSSTRIGVEVVNILKFLGVIKELYFLDKLSLFKQFLIKENLYSVVLFSGNKNKFVMVYVDNDYDIVWREILEKDVLFEEFFEKDYKPLIEYKKVLTYDYNRERADKYLVPFYVFEPITG